MCIYHIGAAFSEENAGYVTCTLYMYSRTSFSVPRIKKLGFELSILYVHIKSVLWLVDFLLLNCKIDFIFT